MVVFPDIMLFTKYDIRWLVGSWGLIYKCSLFYYQFVLGDSIKVTFVIKGGGSECFGGIRYQVVTFAYDVKGIEKFIVDSYIGATRAGTIHPS